MPIAKTMLKNALQEAKGGANGKAQKKQKHKRDAQPSRKEPPSHQSSASCFFFFFQRDQTNTCFTFIPVPRAFPIQGMIFKKRQKFPNGRMTVSTVVCASRTTRFPFLLSLLLLLSPFLRRHSRHPW
jgi:hypothetical protein